MFVLFDDVISGIARNFPGGGGKTSHGGGGALTTAMPLFQYNFQSRVPSVCLYILMAQYQSPVPVMFAGE